MKRRAEEQKEESKKEEEDQQMLALMQELSVQAEPDTAGHRVEEAARSLAGRVGVGRTTHCCRTLMAATESECQRVEGHWNSYSSQH